MSLWFDLSQLIRRKIRLLKTIFSSTYLMSLFFNCWPKEELSTRGIQNMDTAKKQVSQTILPTWQYSLWGRQSSERSWRRRSFLWSCHYIFDLCQSWSNFRFKSFGILKKRRKHIYNILSCVLPRVLLFNSYHICSSLRNLK